MQKRTVIGLLFISMIFLLVGCAPMTGMKTGWDYYPPEKSYLVYGRVMAFNHQPVAGCKVVLVRQKSKLDLDDDDPRSKLAGDKVVDAEYLVATSSKTGDFSFNFEPWDAYDVWLYFDARGQGYQAQIAQLNGYIRAFVARGYGKSPINIDIILEPIKDDEERRLLSSSN